MVLGHLRKPRKGEQSLGRCYKALEGINNTVDVSKLLSFLPIYVYSLVSYKRFKLFKLHNLNLWLW
jgi:hypothetical protein